MRISDWSSDVCSSDLPGATVIGDVKCSEALFDGIAAAGGRPLMWKTGHSVIKAKMKEVGAPLAGEMAAHFVIGEIGRAHVCTPVTNAHHACRLLLAKTINTSAAITYKQLILYLRI